MRCNKAREFISDALDARLDEGRGLELSAHLDGCVDCSRHQSVLERTRPLLSEDLREPSENFDWKVQLKIQQALREKAAPADAALGWNFWRPALSSATGVALVVLVGGGLLLGRPSLPGSGPELVASPLQPVHSAGRAAPAQEVAAATEPDLSGAVRANPLKINPAMNGFGIRTVAGEQFLNRSPFPDPRPVTGSGHWREERGGQSVEVRRVMTEDGGSYVMLIYRGTGPGAGLKRDASRSTLRVIHPVAGPDIRRRAPGP